MAASPSAVQNLVDLDLVRRLIEFTPDAMLVVSTDGQIALANSQAELLFGYSAKDMIDQSIEMLVPRRFGKQHKRHRHDFVGDDRVRQMGTGLKVSARCKDGTEVSCAISLRNIDTSHGRFSIATARAVPSLDELEDEIRQAEAHFRPFLEL